MDTSGEAAVYGGGDDRTYLDVQATLGISKHLGGYRATDALYERCHVDEARHALDVGCGIGTGPSYMARRFSCRVTAMDLSAKMLAWADDRARRHDVRDRIVFVQGDVRALPFDDASFDAVIVESVLAFVEDKAGAVAELARVTRPGGYVGLNESFWIEQPPEHLLAYGSSIGPQIITEAAWRDLWSSAPLEDRRIDVVSLTANQELKDRIEWVGWRAVLPAWARAIKLAVTDRRFREALQSQMDMPRELAAHLGGALFVGRKPRSAQA